MVRGRLESLIVRGLRPRHTLLLLPVAVGLSLLAVSLTRPSISSSSLQCAAANVSFVPSTAYGDFVTFTNQKMNTSPFHAAASGPQQQDFVAGRLVGSLSSIALRDPYRAEEDAMSSSLHYTIGPFPRVPLSGPVVQDTPGVLEAYETHLAFSNASAASTVLSDFRLSNQRFLVDTHGLKDVAADQLVATSEPATAPTREAAVRVAFVRGSVYVALTFLGGRSTSIGSISSYVRLSQARLDQQCRI